MYVTSILPIAANNIFINRTKSVCRIKNGTYNSDVFIKSTNVNFEGTSAGTPLKRLKNITDPYSGIKMINKTEMTKIENDLNSKNTIIKVVNYLKKYKKNMQPVEREVFEDFENSAKNSQRMEMQDLLKIRYNDALQNLKKEELSVFDQMDSMTKDLSEDTAQNVKDKITSCRQLVYQGQGFKRKDILAIFDNIVAPDSDRVTIDNIRETAYFLPTSNTSKNAFIVKYSDRKHDEISKRLVRSSLQTIEHIHPESDGGENNISNFMLASASVNNLRGNMPFKKFIKRYPKVIKNCQTYIEDIIDVIHRGGLKGNETYPYKLRKTLIEESGNKIKLDLQSYHWSKEKAEKIEKQNNKRKH